MGRLVKFGISRIQKLNRIAFPEALLENLNLKIGNEVEIFFNVEDNQIEICRDISKKDQKNVKFGICKIQKLNRIAFSYAILSNLNLKIGDSVFLYFDVDGEKIVISKKGGSHE